jgi:hypothetical protein
MMDLFGFFPAQKFSHALELCPNHYQTHETNDTSLDVYGRNRNYQEVAVLLGSPETGFKTKIRSPWKL